MVPTRSTQPRSSTYRSPLRARQAEETRRTVVAAATRLFGERGWAGTTLSAVAAEAGTAIETVYAGFGSKSGLLVAAIDAAILGGDDQDGLFVDRPEFALLGVGPRRERLASAARIITETLVRAVPLMGALREASGSDKAARSRLQRYEADRRTTVAAGLGLVLGEWPSEALTDSMWALASPEVFVKLTRERGWSVGDYEAWLVESARALLLNPNR